MKNSIVIFAFCLTFSLSSYAQVPQPEFDNVPVYLDPTTNALKNLERPVVNRGARATGFSSVESYLAVAGTTSSVRFKKDHLPKIYVKEPQGSDPAAMLQFASFNINKKKDEREYLLKKSGFGHSETTQTAVGIDFKKVGDGVYEIVFAGDVGKGEYVFGSEKTQRVFCFTVYDGSDNGETQGEDLKDTKKKH